MTGEAGNDVLHGNDGEDSLYGGVGNDTLYGGEGWDVLHDGGDADEMHGGIGYDTYFVSHAGTVVVEFDSGPFVNNRDNVIASIDYTLTDHVENLTLTGEAIHGTGNGLGNTLQGNALGNVLNGVGGFDQLMGLGGDDRLDGGDGNDGLDGGEGNDTLIGGLGGDSYVVDSADDVVVEDDAGLPADINDWDVVRSSVDYTLGVNVEVLELQGDGDLTGTAGETGSSLVGNSGKNLLSGRDGADTLIGGLGFDTLAGGQGDDFYVNDGQDLMVELAGAGTDGVGTYVSYTLGDNLERLFLYIGDINGTGNALDNSLGGSAGNNILDGGAGNDTMNGQQGDDTYIVSQAGDEVFETANRGHELVLSSVSFTLRDHIEDLTLTGTANINGTGNSGNNVLTGNSGMNILTGGLGDDIYYVDNPGDKVNEIHLQGTDTIFSSVSYSLFGRAVEVLTLTGMNNLSVTGNSLNNTLTGNDGNNNFDGAGGADKMAGGLGDDTYYVDHVQDNVAELHLQGTDTIFTSVSYSLFGRAVEILTMTGVDNLSVTGNSLNNTLTGNGGNNSFDGGTGADRMIGGLGDDTYYVDHAQDNVAELHLQGTDTVFSSVTYSFFGRAAELLTLTGSANINGTGNSLANTLTGNIGSNILDGAGGKDYLTGGLGTDTFLFLTGSGMDTVTDFSAVENDSVNINAYTGGVANASLVTQSGLDVVITLGGGNVITVSNSSQADVLSHIVW